MIAVLAAIAVLLGVLSVRQSTVIPDVESYVIAPTAGSLAPISRPPISPSAPSLLGAAIGFAVFPVGPVAGAVVGFICGHFVLSIRRRSVRRQATTRLGQELPAVADLLGLFVLSGDSVLGSVRHFCSVATGVAATELGELVADVDEGTGFAEATLAAARRSAHRDGGRLYELLAQAHRSGARLVDALELFATDRRAALSRELAIEGGRRALTGYGPILGLMVPTTLVFLMYPTLAGLDALSQTQ